MTTKVFGFLAAATLATALSSFAGAANAASLSYSASTDYEVTDIVDTQINIQKFNSSLGTLKGITIDFIGDIQGDAGFENKSTRDSSIAVNLSSIFDLKLNGQSLLGLTPVKSSTYQTSKYDGKTDFTGTSGREIEGLMATQSATKTFTDSQLLQSFIGNGNVNFLFSAIANSTVQGSGNIVSYVNTLAKTNVKVTYDYDPAKSVPEPSALIGTTVVGGIALLSQRKKKLARNHN